MSRPQSAVIAPTGSHALYLLLKLIPGATVRQRVVRQCASLPALLEGAQQAEAEGRVRAALGFAPQFWRQLQLPAEPPGLTLCQTQNHNGADSADIFLHIHASRADLCFTLARQFFYPLNDLFSLREEVHSSRYREGYDVESLACRAVCDDTRAARAQRALLAVDGTQSGGSYAFVRQYLYVLPTVTEEDEPVGAPLRLDQALLSRQSHSSEAVCHSQPYVLHDGGNGLMLLAYSQNPNTFNGLRQELSVMNEVRDGRLHILHEGCFFIPSEEQLRHLRKVGT